jgi:hypothetical protein
VTSNENACRNCDTPLAPGQKFCGACGQRVVAARLTMGEIFHDFFHAITHVDHSILSLIRGLVTQPGKVARDYIEGRRKRWFGPFAFLVIAVGLASFVIVVTGVQMFRPLTDSGAAPFLQRHVNLVSLLQLPLLAGCAALLFIEQKLFFAEHLVLCAYAAGMRVLFLGVIETPFIWLTGLSTTHPVAVGIYLGAWFLYFAVAAAQFYRGNRAGVMARAVLAAIASQALITYIIFVFILGFSHFQH